MENTKKQPTMVYVKHRSGSVLHPNLDDVTLLNLLETQALHKQRGHLFSQSVIMRRAIRLYHSYLKRLTNWDGEIKETRRAEKGVC